MDKHAIRELELFIDNDGALYRKRFMPILHNQCRHKQRGRWSATQSVKGWMYLVDDGAKKYHRQFGSGGKWNDMFPMSVRRALAARYARATKTQCQEHGIKKTAPRARPTLHGLKKKRSR